MALRKPWGDAGHGGTDPGAVGVVKEKDPNLAITNLFVAGCKRQGWQAGATRADDRFVALSARCLKANAAGADAFVSFHADWTGAEGKGFQAIHNPTSANGYRLADTIFDELDPLTAYKDVGVYADRRGLAVLRGTNMPAAIIEVLSVAEATLADPVFQAAVAECAVKGLCRWYGETYVPPGKKAPATPVTRPAPVPKPHQAQTWPKWPGRLLKYVKGRALMTGSDVRTWQARMKARGWTIDVDGVYGPQSAAVCRAFQIEKKLAVDSIVGSSTWDAAWTAKIT